jgi:hypothetical protein
LYKSWSGPGSEISSSGSIKSPWDPQQYCRYHGTTTLLSTKFGVQQINLEILVLVFH